MGATQSSAFRVYYNPASTNSMRVLMYLEEAKLQYELVSVDLQKGEHKADEFRKLNPRMQVPFLVQDDIHMGESVAIIEYLGRIHPNESLFPVKDPESCALNCRLIAEFHQKLDPRNIMATVIYQKKTREQIGEDRIQSLFTELEVWEDYLAGENDYLIGDEISTSDIIVFPNIAVLFWLLGLPERDFPFLAAWYHRMRSRPSVAKLEYWKVVDPRPEWRILERRTL
jgi:glutathione S-transferase